MMVRDVNSGVKIRFCGRKFVLLGLKAPVLKLKMIRYLVHKPTIVSEYKPQLRNNILTACVGIHQVSVPFLESEN